MAYIIDSDGFTITEGLQGCTVFDEALLAARRQAAQRGQSVVLVDDDGAWRVQPDGECIAMGIED